MERLPWNAQVVLCLIVTVGDFRKCVKGSRMQSRIENGPAHPVDAGADAVANACGNWM